MRTAATPARGMNATARSNSAIDPISKSLPRHLLETKNHMGFGLLAQHAKAQVAIRFGIGFVEEADAHPVTPRVMP